MIVVFGTVCLDRVRRIPHLPAAGGYVEVESEVLLLGGEAANTANALRRWGAEVALCGNGVGQGIDGDLLTSYLSERGLVSQAAGKLPSTQATPVCDVYVTPDGERTMIGRGFRQMEPEFDPSVLPLAKGGWFTAEPNMSVLSRKVVKAAQKEGMKTYLMDFVRADDPIVRGSFWQSSTDWAGHRNDMQRNLRWVSDWAARYECFAILSDGPNGFVAGSPEVPVRAYPPFPSPPVVDTTGAGDLFRAGMLFGLSQDWPISKCLQFASVAGCLKCRALGATTDVPTVAEIEAYLVRYAGVARQYEIT